MSRPIKDKDRLEMNIKIRVSKEMYSKLNYLSKVSGRGISEVVRDCLERHIK